MRSLALPLIVLCACVGDSSTPTDAGIDASGSDAVVDTSTKDAPADAPADVVAAACDLQKPFGTPSLVPNVNSTDNDYGYVWNDTTMYISSYRSGGAGDFDLWIATRTDTSSPFGAPTVVPLTTGGLNSAKIDIDISLTSDGLTAYFATSRASTSGATDIWVATRRSTVADFANAAQVANINSPTFQERQPWISGDGSTLYFASSTATGYDDIYRATKSGSQFGAPTLVTELAMPGYDFAPVLDASQLTIYFASDRAGGVGSLDVWSATRSSTSVAFGTPTNVTTVNSTGDEFPTALSTDGCILYMASSRQGTTGNSDIWQAIRPK